MRISITNEDDKDVLKGPLWSYAISAVLFLALVYFVITHLDEVNKILIIIKGAKPGWVALAIVAELLTYAFAGAVWHIVAKNSKYHLSMKSLAALAIKQLTINHIIPTGGIAGNVVIVRSMKRLGLSSVLAMEILFIDLLAYYISFTCVTFFSLFILWFYNDITPIILGLMSISLVLELFLSSIIWAAVNHKKINLPEWIKNKKIVSRILGEIETISSKRVFSLEILTKSSLLRLGIFLLDSATLFFVMKAIAVPGTFLTAFIAVVVASVAGSIIITPGGFGAFEAGSVGILILLGTPTGAAIASILLFRGLSLWIPLIPGLILVREDLKFNGKTQNQQVIGN